MEKRLAGSKPKHFASNVDFTRCILEWAINDRIALLAAYAGCNEKSDLALIQETRAEIDAIRNRLRKVNSKEYIRALNHASQV